MGRGAVNGKSSKPVSTPKESFFRKTSYEGLQTKEAQLQLVLYKDNGRGRHGVFWKNCYWASAGRASVPGVVTSALRFAQTFDSQVGKAHPPREALISSMELHVACLSKMCDRI